MKTKLKEKQNVIVKQQKIIVNLITTREDSDANTANDGSNLAKEKVQKLEQLLRSPNMLESHLIDTT